jgi:hypothetical protein
MTQNDTQLAETTVCKEEAAQGANIQAHDIR